MIYQNNYVQVSVRKQRDYDTKKYKLTYSEKVIRKI